MIRVRRFARFPAKLGIAAFVLGISSACTGPAGGDRPPAVVAGIPAGPIQKVSTADPLLLAGPVPLDVDPALPAILAVRTNLRSGAFEILVSGPGTGDVRRRVERIGANLTIVPLPAVPSASLAVYQSANAGPLDFEVLGVTLTPVDPSAASRTAAGLAATFEAETGQLADPRVENLVPNASFAADDEVRGVPADWFAYVDTQANSLDRTLRVAGAPPEGRPYLATGPVRVESGRRYRILLRMAVRAGSVVVRVADYDELRTLAVIGTVSSVDGPVERWISLAASDGDRAFRVRFEPPRAGDAAEFEISAIQMELLPVG